MGAGDPAATVATRQVTFASKTCSPVVPVVPAVSATCVAGVVTAPTVEPSVGPTTGITYVVAPADLGDGTADVDVTVTATVLDDVRVGNDRVAVGAGQRVDAKWTRTLPAGTCAKAVPVGPTVVEAVCTAGVVTAPTLTVTETDQIDYSVSPAGPYMQGQTVTVTATLVGGGAGLGWGTLVAPWGPGIRRRRWRRGRWTFASRTCQPVVPAVPVVVGTCTTGVITATTVELAATRDSSTSPLRLGRTTRPSRPTWS